MCRLVDLDGLRAIAGEEMGVAIDNMRLRYGSRGEPSPGRGQAHDQSVSAARAAPYVVWQLLACRPFLRPRKRRRMKRRRSNACAMRFPFLDTAPTWNGGGCGPDGALENPPAASVESEIDAQRRIIAEQRALIDQQNAMLAERRQHIVKMQGSAASPSRRRSTGSRPSRSPKRAARHVPRDRHGARHCRPRAFRAPAATRSRCPMRRSARRRRRASRTAERVAAVPEGQGVLTRAGNLISSNPRSNIRARRPTVSSFAGSATVPGIQIGLIEATDADRDTLVGTASLRYGISDRLEAEVRIPGLYRNDRIEVVQQRDEGIVRSIALRERRGR